MEGPRVEVKDNRRNHEGALAIPVVGSFCAFGEAKGKPEPQLRLAACILPIGPPNRARTFSRTTTTTNLQAVECRYSLPWTFAMTQQAVLDRL